MRNFRLLIQFVLLIVAALFIAHGGMAEGVTLGMAGFLGGAEYRGLTRNVRAVAYNRLKATPAVAIVRTIFQIIQSNSIQETFVFLRGIPKMRHWTGDRVLNGFGWASFSMEKKDWEATVAITRDDLQFDRLGLIRPNIESLADSFPRHYLDFVVDLLANGDDRLAYDGQFFFDTDHNAGDGTSYSNKTTSAFSRATWEVAETAPLALSDPDTQEPLEVMWTDVVYGYAAQASIDAVFNSDSYVDGSGNVLPNRHFNKIPRERQHMLRGFGNSGKVFLLDLSKPIKPLLLQIVAGVSFEAYDDPHDWNMFNRKEAVYGIESQDNAAYGFWELAYMFTNGE